MKKRRKQYLVLGLGRFGASVAIHLCKLGHEVMAVDRDETLVKALAPMVTQAVQADATDEAVLQELDAGHFDAAVIGIGTNTRDSILVTVLCKEAGVPMVVAKAVDELHAKVLRKVGSDRVVFPERDMGQRVAKALDAPIILDLMELSGDYRIAEVYAPERWCGKTLAEVNVRRTFGLSIVGIRRKSVFLASPGAEMLLHTGDILLVLGRTKDIEAID